MEIVRKYSISTSLNTQSLSITR